MWCDKRIDIVYLGWPKAGSTWFHRFCEESPDLLVSSAKDTYLFSKSAGVSVESIFPDVDSSFDDTKLVEINHDYVFSLEALSKISAHNPNAKVVVFFREPISWLISEYKYVTATGAVSCSFEEFLATYDYLRGRLSISEHIENVHKIFGKNNTFCYPVEHLREQPNDFAEKLCSFCDISNDFLNQYDFSTSVNSAITPRLKFLPVLINFARKVRDFTGLYRLYGLVKRGSLRKLMYSNSSSKLNYDWARSKVLLSDLNITDEINKIENILDFELTSWKK